MCDVGSSPGLHALGELALEQPVLVDLAVDGAGGEQLLVRPAGGDPAGVEHDQLVGERGITLSGGQRQRVAIARALIVDPRVLILDDATASVDASTEARIRVGLREAMRNRTTLIIAHRLSTIALADEIVVLDDGRIAARGTHEELLATSEVYRDIYDHGLLERQFADAVEARAETAALEAAS